MAQHQDALIYIMILVSAADNDMRDEELARIGQMVNRLPVFDDYDENELPLAAQKCAVFLEDEDDGLDNLLTLIKEMLPASLSETAYALACDVAAADRRVSEEEMAVLGLMADLLGVDDLAAAAIERGARARHMVYVS